MNARNIETLRAFYAGNRQQLYTYAVSITQNREAAEDAIHGVFEKLLQGAKLPADLRPYLFRSIRNAALDGWRRTKVRRDSMFEAAVAMDPAGHDAQTSAAVEDLQELLDALTPDERESVVLRIYGGLTFKEIAAMRDVPLPTVASWYRRALERLRAMLKEER